MDSYSKPMVTTPYGEQPAFPTDNAVVERYSSGETKRHAPGLTVRDWFAGQALVGMLAAQADPDVTSLPVPADAAVYAYRVADAMLEARKPKKS